MTAVNQNVGTSAADPVFPNATVRLSVAVTDPGGSVTDLTNVQEINYGIYGVSPDKDFEAPAIIPKTLGSGVTVTNAAGGIFEVEILPADTKSLWPGSYYHQAEILDAANDRYPALTGTFKLTARF